MTLPRLSPTGSELQLINVPLVGAGLAPDGVPSALAAATVSVDSEQLAQITGALHFAATAPLVLAYELVAINAAAAETVIASGELNFANSGRQAIPAGFFTIPSDIVSFQIRGTPTGGNLTIQTASNAALQLLSY
jgi:hypothetical protein